uniref:Uncharacterized protein n=1 Tax=viral metagenome TaxID=1070528 RepID=A0A6C0I673_9ZZZZ
MKDKTTILVSVLAVALAFAVLTRLFESREGFSQQSAGAPIASEGIGSYDGIDISNGGNMWSSTPKPTPLKPYENADDNQLFQYQESKFTPECCPSAITNDVGCLCATPQEEKDWVTRGGNRSGSGPDITV